MHYDYSVGWLLFFNGSSNSKRLEGVPHSLGILWARKALQVIEVPWPKKVHRSAVDDKQRLLISCYRAGLNPKLRWERLGIHSERLIGLLQSRPLSSSSNLADFALGPYGTLKGYQIDVENQSSCS